MRRTFVFLPVVLLFILAGLCQANTPAGNSGQPEGAAKSFRVLDISERTWDNGPAIAVLLSAPLDPKVRHDQHLRISDTRQLLKSAWVLSEDGRTLWFPHVEPETEYSVSVLETLQAANGDVLGDRVSKKVTTRKITPIISFASEGFLLPAKMTQGLPVVTINIRAVNIEFFRLNRAGLVKFVNWRNTTGEKGYYQLTEARKYGEMVFSGRFDLDVPENRRTVYHIPVEEIEPLQQPGVYLAVMREPGQYDYSYHVTYFLVTDIGLHARVYRDESLIFASSLRSGKPLPGLEMTLYDKDGKTLATGRTDEDGKYRFSGQMKTSVNLVMASGEGQVGVLPLNIPALDMSDFDLGKRKYRPREIFAYSPRNLYRPGETVTVSALLRSDDGKPVDPLPLTARLCRPDGREVKHFIWQPQPPDTAGVSYYQTTLDLPPDAQTGLWQLKLWDDPSSDDPATVFPFRAEEFLPERMKLALTATPDFPGPDASLVIEADGQYLYGAPAAGNEIGTRVRVRAEREPLAAFRGYEFGDIKDKDYRDYWERDNETLDNQGKARLEIPSRWASVRSPLSVRVTADLFESGGRPVTRGVEKTVWPGGTAIGIRPLFKEGVTDAGPVGFEVVRVRPDGTLAPADGLMVELTKEDRDYYWEYSDSTGWLYKYTEKTYRFLTDTLNLRKETPTPCTFQLERGQYVLEIRDPETALVSGLRFRVGRWWYGEDQADMARPDKVVLTPDQTAYRPGDMIQLTVTPPHDGEALITVEGEKPLWVKRTPVSAGGTVVEIPILAGWDRHNLYISAVVFRPADAEEKITPNRAVGLVHIPLDRSSRKLELKIDAPEKAVPQGPMTVSLKLEKPALPAPDEPVFVTLAAVDVGILSITDFKTPDPFAWFFERRRYGVNAYDVYGKVIENADGNMAALRFGGDADLTAGKRPENKVRLLSLFQGPVQLDENGEASVTFALPDFNGTLRLMAVAFTPTCFGSAEREVTVAAPVVTQLAMPRFLAPGDVSEFTLDIHNLSGAAKTVDLDLKSDGPVVLENGTQTVKLADGEKKTLRFPVRAEADFGKSVITLVTAGEGFHLTREWQLGVRPGYPATARKVFSMIRPGGVFSLDPKLSADLIPSTVDADLKISPQLPLNFRSAMRGLITYPYGCLEQTTSRAYPLLFATPVQIARYQLPPIAEAERLRRLNTALERLTTLQLASGGFGLWNKSSPESPWLTVYVTEFLLAARAMSLDVSETMLDKALKRIEIYLTRGAPLTDYMDNAERDHLSFAVQSYAAYVLSLLNRAPLGTLRTLYDNHHEQAGSCLPLAHLGIALKRMGDAERSRKALEEATGKRPGMYGYWGDYSSLVRDLAMTLTLMVSHKADDTEGFDRIISDLEKALRQREWLSTQEKFAIFAAGLTLSDLAGEAWQGRLSIAGRESALQHKGALLKRLSAGDIASGVSFISDHGERLYVSAVIDGYPRTPPAREDARIAISRELFDLRGNPADRTGFNVGELLLVHLRISAKERIPDALVVDLLPAGFEAENQNLKHSFKMEDLTIDGKSVWKLRENAEILHEEYRDDRYVAAVRLSDYAQTHLFYLVRVVSPGTFVMPPAFVESMYRPEIRGVGDTPAPVRVLNKSR
ncbi:alpha-2-macroglobulin domain-containing protein [Desulfonema ishimotonii]|uniref:Alpha-2-macroglobulin domain-containing protein n=1 Tax=Desulfonema ishimotonii TaxID=45657 RepID=A0A401FUF4_9BACT|nr:alpha-2-macroglobulin [Desulfonema ishimotonii]GBC60596.1 alpha-2-macroglobulin domain-containing protein [Desulfonema ishimotonii]